MIVRKVVRGLADRTTIIRHWQTMSNFRALGCKYRVWLSCPCALAAFDASCYGLCPRTLQLKLYLERAHGCKPRPNPRRTSSVLRANLQRTSGVPRANLQRTSSELRAYLERTSSVPVPNLRCDNLTFFERYCTYVTLLISLHVSLYVCCPTKPCHSVCLSDFIAVYNKPDQAPKYSLPPSYN